MNQEGVKLKRKDYVKSIIDSILDDDEKLTDMANQCFGGIEAIQSVYEAVNVYGVDRELLREHINRMLDEPDTIECPTCFLYRNVKETCPDCKGSGRVKAEPKPKKKGVGILKRCSYCEEIFEPDWLREKDGDIFCYDCYMGIGSVEDESDPKPQEGSD